jgi:hypothetical protein
MSPLMLLATDFCNDLSLVYSGAVRQRAAAAFLAIAERCSFVSLAARALPPTNPPLAANSDRSAFESAAILAFPPRFPPSRPRRTAAGFLAFVVRTKAFYHGSFLVLDKTGLVMHNGFVT